MTIMEIREHLEMPIMVAQITNSPVKVPMDVMRAILEKLEKSEDDAEED